MYLTSVLAEWLHNDSLFKYIALHQQRCISQASGDDVYLTIYLAFNNAHACATSTNGHVQQHNLQIFASGPKIHRTSLASQ